MCFARKQAFTRHKDIGAHRYKKAVEHFDKNSV